MSRRALATLLFVVVTASTPVTLAKASDQDFVGGPCTPPDGALPRPGCVPSLVGDTRDMFDTPRMLPDLVPVAPFFVDIGPPPRESSLPVKINLEPPSDERVLRFTTVMVNEGRFALDLLGVPTADPERAEARQCVSWTERVCRERESVGDLIWHPEHNHFHFEHFAHYELRWLGSDGTPDFSDAGLVVTSEKVSFCLQDSTQHEPDAPTRFYVGCTGAVQGISPGWADIYGHTLVGQLLAVAGLPDGRYALVFVADPQDRLLEQDDGNNTAWSVIELSNGGTTAGVVE